MSNFYDQSLEELKTSAQAGMCKRFPMSIEEARVFTGNPRDSLPQRIRRGRFDPTQTWFMELRDLIAAIKPEGIMFRIRLNLIENWPIPWSESVDRSEKDAAVIVLLHKSLKQPLFWAASVGEPTYSQPALDDPNPNPKEFTQLGTWIEIDGSSVPEEYKTLMDGIQ